MLIQPPRLDVLVAVDPRLACAIGNGRAYLRQPVGFARVVPIVTLAALEVSPKIVEIVNRARAVLIVDMVDTIAPIGERPIDVDTDGVDA